MSRHVKDVHENEINPCDECGRSFRTRSGLNSHVLHVHLRKKSQDKKKKSFRGCPHCPALIQSTKSLQYRRHLCEVHPEIHLASTTTKDRDHPSSTTTLLPCRVCFHTFPSSEELETHVVNSHGKEKCPICGLQFRHEYLLKTHHATVHVEGSRQDRPYKCDHCDSYFKTKQRLGVSYHNMISYELKCG